MAGNFELTALMRKVGIERHDLVCAAFGLNTIQINSIFIGRCSSAVYVTIEKSQVNLHKLRRGRNYFLVFVGHALRLGLRLCAVYRRYL